MRPHRPLPLVLASGLGLALAAVLLTLAFAGRSLSQQGEPVAVVNFPETQQVAGSVTVDGVVRHGLLQQPSGEVVVSPTADRISLSSLVAGGVLETDGFTRVVLSLAGEVKGRVEKSGEVGAILLPDVAMVRDALEDEDVLLFPLEVAAAVDRPSAYAGSESVERTVAFPRYRIYYYNTTDRAIGARLFAYLTH